MMTMTYWGAAIAFEKSSYRALYGLRLERLSGGGLGRCTTRQTGTLLHYVTYSDYD